MTDPPTRPSCSAPGAGWSGSRDGRPDETDPCTGGEQVQCQLVNQQVKKCQIAKQQLLVL